MGQNRENDHWSDFRVGAIPGVIEFHQLTKYERTFDSFTQQIKAEQLKYLSALANTKQISQDSLKRIDSIMQKDIAVNAMRYKDNRSRHYLQLYSNGHRVNEPTNVLDSIGAGCSCILDHDTIRVIMGMFASPISFILKLNKHRISGSASLYEKTYARFSLDKNDTTGYQSMAVPFMSKSLLLNNAPAYKVGEQITGRLQFQTTPYYRYSIPGEDTDQLIYSTTRTSRLQLKGTIVFTCQVR